MQKENLSTDYSTTNQISDHQVLEQAAVIRTSSFRHRVK